MSSDTSKIDLCMDEDEPVTSRGKKRPFDLTSETQPEDRSWFDSNGTKVRRLFSSRRLQNAEKSRQDQIRQSVASYLAQYPSVDATYPKAIFQNEHKGVIYQTVTQMMEDKRNSADHFREAFEYYTWLPSYVPRLNDDPTEKTLLHYACLHGRDDVLQLLLAHHPRCHQQDEKSYIPLHLAAKQGHLDCLSRLHSYAPEFLDMCDFEGRTPLMVAAFFHQTDVVKQLLDWGANLAAKDTSKDTVAEIAKKQGHNEVVKAIRAFQHSRI